MTVFEIASFFSYIHYFMNMKIFDIIIITFIISLLVGCKRDKDSYYFNGEIQYFDDSQKMVKNVTSKSVSLDGIPTGMIAVYDSILICWSSEYSGRFFYIINLDSGKEIGFFCEKGRGPKETISVNPIYQLFLKENELCTYLWAYNESRLFLWNINQSIEKGMTVYDTIISYDKNRYRFLFYQPEDALFVNRPSDFLNREEVTTPFYEKRTINSKEVIQDYRIYKKPLLRSSDVAKLERSFYTWDVIKPDGTKIAQAMRHLPQINILDTHTGDIVGFRMRNSPDFSFLDKVADIKWRDEYYINIHADNNYIYATYWGKEPWSGRIDDGFPFVNIIHIFDWNGKQLYELVTDRSFFHVWVDQIRNRLYTIDMNNDDVYYIDLNELNL